MALPPFGIRVWPLSTKQDAMGSVMKTQNPRNHCLRDFIENGALLGVVPDYYQLGKAVASILDRHEKGERLQGIAVQTPQNPLLMINTTTADLLKTTIPEDVLKKAIIVE
jgi:ABC-type uncharacterized transport system substrate-binding protein